jgi:hypothetical protein
MKKSIINLRLDEQDKKAMERVCSDNGVPISVGARDAIKLYLENQSSSSKPSIPEEDPSELESWEVPFYNEDFTLLKSWLFTRLVHWVTIKRYDPVIRSNSNFYINCMNLIASMDDNSYFPNDILIEFNKIRKELYDYLYGQTHNRTFFQFARFGGFDYVKFDLFMRDMNYSEEGMKIIYLDINR